MDFTADENVDRQIVERLEADGHSVRAIAETDPGIADDFVLRLANQTHSILLTADKDFGELIFRQQKPTVGIVLLRLAGVAPEEKAIIVAAAVRAHASELAGAFTVVTVKTVRVRRRVR